MRAASTAFRFLCLILAAGAMSAQSLPDAGRISREVQGERRTEADNTAPDIQRPESGPSVAGAEGQAITVSRWIITGNTLIPTVELEVLLGSLTGRTLTFAEVEAAAGRVSAAFRQRGYLLARAYVPAQEVTNGEVTINVLEGRLGEVLVTDTAGAPLRQAGLGEYFKSLHQRGPALAVENLERPLLLLNERPGLSASVLLQPGDDVGSADLIVRVDQRAWEGGVGLSNHGSRFTGEWITSADVQASNRWGHGESLFAHALVSDDGGIVSGGAGGSLPLGVRGWTLHAQASHLAYRIGEEFAALDARGRATDGSLELQYAWIRTRQARLTAAVSASHHSLQDELRAAGSENRREVTSVVTRMEGQLQDAHGASGFHLACTVGRADLRSPFQYTFDQSAVGRGVHGGYGKANLTLWRVQKLDLNWSVFISAEGQYATKNLDTSERSALGGPGGVRAYPVSEVAADQTLIGRVELRRQLPALSVVKGGQVYLFGDAGEAWLNRIVRPIDPENRRSLQGAGVGASLLLRGGFELDMTVGWRGQEIAEEDPDAGRARFYGSLRRRF